MKNYKAYILAFLAPILFLSQAHAQKLFLGAAGVYGDDIESFGLNIRSAAFVLPELCIGPEVSFFLPHQEVSDEGELTRRLWELNLNAHYILEIKEGFAFYPLLGLNYSAEAEEIRHNGDVENKTISFFGVNVGGGLHYELEKILFILEYDRLIGQLPQNSFSIGFYVPLGPNKTEHGAKE